MDFTDKMPDYLKGGIVYFNMLLEHLDEQRAKIIEVRSLLMGEEADPESLSLDSLEKEHILKLLKRNKGDKPKTAEQLGIAEKTLYNKLAIYNGGKRDTLELIQKILDSGPKRLSEIARMVGIVDSAVCYHLDRNPNLFTRTDNLWTNRPKETDENP